MRKGALFASLYHPQGLEQALTVSHSVSHYGLDKNELYKQSRFPPFTNLFRPLPLYVCRHMY